MRINENIERMCQIYEAHERERQNRIERNLTAGYLIGDHSHLRYPLGIIYAFSQIARAVVNINQNGYLVTHIPLANQNIFNEPRQFRSNRLIFSLWTNCPIIDQRTGNPISEHREGAELNVNYGNLITHLNMGNNSESEQLVIDTMNRAVSIRNQRHVNIANANRERILGFYEFEQSLPRRS